MGDYNTYYRQITIIKGQNNTVTLTQLYDNIGVDIAIRASGISVNNPYINESYLHTDMPFWFTINDIPATDYPYPWSQWGTTTGSEYDVSYIINPQSMYTLRIELLIEEKSDIDNGVFPPFTKRVYSRIDCVIIDLPKSTQQNINSYGFYDRLIRVEKNVPTNKSFGTDGLYPNGEEIIITSTLPAWITNNVINFKTQTWDITAPSINTYYYFGEVSLRNEYKGAAIITLQVVESLYEEIDNCCSDENVNIVWLNRQGGRGNYIFTQRKDFNVEIGKTNTYLSYDIKKYSEIKNVHNGFKVYATGLTINQIDFLDTLRYSIQCWQFINDTFIPLVLDIGSFEKYNTKENMYEVSMNFIYAERLNIQRQ